MMMNREIEITSELEPRKLWFMLWISHSVVSHKTSTLNRNQRTLPWSHEKTHKIGEIFLVFTATGTTLDHMLHGNEELSPSNIGIWLFSYNWKRHFFHIRDALPLKTPFLTSFQFSDQKMWKRGGGKDASLATSIPLKMTSTRTILQTSGFERCTTWVPLSHLLLSIYRMERELQSFLIIFVLLKT